MLTCYYFTAIIIFIIWIRFYRVLFHFEYEEFSETASRKYSDCKQSNLNYQITRSQERRLSSRQQTTDHYDNNAAGAGNVIARSYLSS